MTLTCFTTDEGVASEASGASAHWGMVHNVTHGINATSTRTWVLASLANAGKVLWTVRVDDALWSTLYIGVAEITRQTSANTSIVLDVAFGIDSTSALLARFWLGWFGHNCNNMKKRQL